MENMVKLDAKTVEVTKSYTQKYNVDDLTREIQMAETDIEIATNRKAELEAILASVQGKLNEVVK